MTNCLQSHLFACIFQSLTEGCMQRERLKDACKVMKIDHVPDEAPWK